MILVVHDEEGMRCALEIILEDAGFSVATARDGLEAVTFYREHCEDVALVICDVRMPVMDGLQTFRELKKIKRTVRVVFESGFVSKVTQAALRKEGVGGFLLKPYSREEILAVVRLALDS